MQMKPVNLFCMPLLLLSAATSTAANRIDTQRPDAPALAAYGDYRVGVRSVQLVNPDQVNVLALNPDAPRPESLPRYDRPLTVEVWYPANATAIGSQTLRAFIRDGTTEVGLEGQAVLYAAPEPAGGPYPLIIVSHGYPGNRFLLSHLAENLGSKGYVVASIDHTDSTYRDLASFGSTLYNRPFDQQFVLDEMARLGNDPASFLDGMINADTTGLIGYSMGGYGAVLSAGGGLTAASVEFDFAPPFGLLDIHREGSQGEAARPDPRLVTAIAFAPWGYNSGMFDAATVSGISIPMLFIAGSADDVSLYAEGSRAIWQGATAVHRSLLTFDQANHNAGAPYPAPHESYAFNERLGFAPFEHYADAVWDTVRMNNISQHFATAWMNRYLKNDASMDAYLELLPDADDGIYAVDEDGQFTDEHSYWNGFPDRSAKALRFETLAPGE